MENKKVQIIDRKSVYCGITEGSPTSSYTFMYDAKVHKNIYELNSIPFKTCMNAKLSLLTEM